MTLDEETQKVAESVRKYSDYPVIQLRVGDLLEIAGYKYQIRIARDNAVVLAPYQPPPCVTVSVD
jgi:hypothetical protein